MANARRNQPKISIKEAVTERDLKKAAVLAAEIWTEHYTPIIGRQQVEYMLEKFQSVEAIEKQISEGMSYYLMFYEGKAVGYMACKPEGEDLFLSKIYVIARHRGKGIGSATMRFLTALAQEHGNRYLSLTVNKNNIDSIRAYEKLGFKNMGPLVTDIGGGFVMDDYLMKKSL